MCNSFPFNNEKRVLGENKMKLISKIDPQKRASRIGIFLCPQCENHVKMSQNIGLRNAVCNTCRRQDVFNGHVPIVKKQLIRQTSKMDWDKVKRIRKIYQNGIRTQKEIAEKFNVSQNLISAIVLNKIWVETYE